MVGQRADEIGARMKGRPQCRVRKSVVVAAVVILRQIDCAQRSVTKGADLDEGVIARGIAEAAARANPDRAKIPHRRQQRRS